MNCKKCQNLMFEYLDQTLFPRTMMRIREHLRTCSRCSEIFDTESRFSDSLKNTLQQELAYLVPDKLLREKIQAAGREAKSQTYIASRKRLVLKPSSLFATLLILLTAIFVMHPMKTQTERDILTSTDTLLSNEDEYALTANPNKDWLERRLTIAIIDEEGHRQATVITSKFPERITVFKNGG